LLSSGLLYVILKSGLNVVQRIKVESTNLSVSGVPVGIYEIETSDANSTIEQKHIIVAQEENEVGLIEPTLRITSNMGDITNADKITYTFIFSEEVIGFTGEDIIVTNGQKGTFEGTGKVYNLEVKNNGSCIQTVTVNKGVCTDAAGNLNEPADKTVTIDKEVEINITKNIKEPTNKDITLTISSDEELNLIVVNGITLKESTYTVSENGSYTFVVSDMVGNVIRQTIIVENIDKIVPKATITYVTNENGTVTATIKFDEENVIITNNAGKTEYVFNKNGEFKFKFKDKAGNAGEATAKVESITENDSYLKPEIIFNELITIEKDGVKYVKTLGMTKDELTSKMNSEALVGETPTYIELTEDGKIKTGTKISLNGEVKYTVIVIGDVNGDGTVSPTDLTYTNSIRLKKVNPTIMQQEAADFNSDGKNNALDLTMINSYRLGKIEN